MLTNILYTRGTYRIKHIEGKPKRIVKPNTKGTMVIWDEIERVKFINLLLNRLKRDENIYDVSIEEDLDNTIITFKKEVKKK